ncbi:MAG: HlyC/CorC family transporter [Nitrospirae bacterium]|nr:HlyC/CorC family transporter [Nitrospirota bacterium]
MPHIWLELISIFLLILLNGFFACSEIAIIAVRRSRIKQLFEQGDRRAGFVHQLKEDTERFLATIQIGVTVVSSLAAAVGGVFAVETLKPIIQQLPNETVQNASEALAVGCVVLVISYFSLIIGELVPKSLALKYSEPIALRVAHPIVWISKVASAFIKFLTISSRFLLRFFKGPVSHEKTFISEEEIKILIREGREKGIFDQTEQDLIHSVFEFTDISVKEVMISRPKMHALQIDTPLDDLLKFVSSHKFSRYPVYRKGIHEIVGILYYKDLMSQVVSKELVVLKDLIRPVYFVPETMKVSHLLKELQRRRIQMAIVVNEYGSIEGLVTMEDLVEEIVGEIQDEVDRGDRPVERLKDGSMVVDASMSVRDLHDDYGLSLPESSEYETLGGFFLSQLQSIPRGGEIIQYGKNKFTVVDMADRRIAKVKVEKIQEKVSS